MFFRVCAFSCVRLYTLLPLFFSLLIFSSLLVLLSCVFLFFLRFLFLFVPSCSRFLTCSSSQPTHDHPYWEIPAHGVPSWFPSKNSTVTSQSKRLHFIGHDHVCLWSRLCKAAANPEGYHPSVWLQGIQFLTRWRRTWLVFSSCRTTDFSSRSWLHNFWRWRSSRLSR